MHSQELMIRPVFVAFERLMYDKKKPKGFI